MKKILALMLSILMVSFPVFFRSNSKQPVEPTLTSTVTAVKKETAKYSMTNITISFLGDCMMASYCGQASKGNMNWCIKNYDTSYFFEKAYPFISKDDFTIANCECVLSDKSLSKTQKNYSPAYWYMGPTKVATVFKNSSIEAVSLSNNHAKDYGNTGYQDTRNCLEKASVKWGDFENPIILEKDGIKIAVICNGFWNGYQQSDIVKVIKEVSKYTDIQVVFFHGGTERIHTPEKWKVTGCHAFVDAGADLVIGGHHHVLQPYEEYKGVSIIYSLGNFCYGGSKSPENRTIIYQHTFTVDENKKIVSSVENIIPFYVFSGKTNNWQPCPVEDKDVYNNIMNFMHGKTDSPV
jgi:poly-gamma-glutamate synthesis protein (capsule biosynthesis protein)